MVNVVTIATDIFHNCHFSEHASYIFTPTSTVYSLKLNFPNGDDINFGNDK